MKKKLFYRTEVKKTAEETACRAKTTERLLKLMHYTIIWKPHLTV